MSEATTNQELVWVVYGQDLVYGRDTHILGIFANEVKAAVFASRMTLADKHYNYVWEKHEVIQ